MTDHDYLDAEDTGPPTLEDDAWLTLVLYATPRKHRRGDTPYPHQITLEEVLADPRD